MSEEEGEHGKPLHFHLHGLVLKCTDWALAQGGDDGSGGALPSLPSSAAAAAAAATTTSPPCSQVVQVGKRERERERERERNASKIGA